MNFTSRTQGRVSIIALQGRFDAHMAPPVAAWLEAAAASAPARVLVNLSGVNFVDSTALATMVQGMKRCRQMGGDLHLCGLQQPLRIIFELTRLDRAFGMFVSEEEAISAFEE